MASSLELLSLMWTLSIGRFMKYRKQVVTLGGKDIKDMKIKSAACRIYIMDASLLYKSISS
jgi:hypothetical protein